MLYIKNLTFFVIGLSCFILTAQSNFNTFGESALSIDHKFSKSYSANFAILSRYNLYNNDQGIQYMQQHIEAIHFSTLSLNFNHKLSLGIYYRKKDWFETGSNELRICQQFTYTKQKLGVRYGHRFRLEQRILDEQTIFRQRYRFAVDFPLNGEKLDIGEPYLISAAEGLLSLSKPNKPQTDVRLSSQIGWQITEVLKLQTGLECRIEAFNLETENKLFLLTSAILKI